MLEQLVAAAKRADRTQFIDRFAVTYGPTDLLVDLFLKSDAEAISQGVLLTIGSFAELRDLNQRHRETWNPLAPPLDCRNFTLDSANSHCLLGIDETGEVVCAQAARLFDWTGTNMAEEARALRLFYADPATMKNPGEACEVTAGTAESITGIVVYSGANWVRGDWRGRGLGTLLARLAKAYAFTRWDPDYVVSLMSDPNRERGLAEKTGYTKVERGFDLRRSVAGDVHFALVSMDMAGLVRHVEAFIAAFPEEKLALVRS